MKVIFWYEIVCVIFVLSLIPLICGVIILSFMIRHSYRKKNLSNYVNKTQDNILFSTMYGVINCYLYDTLCPFDSL